MAEQKKEEKKEESVKVKQERINKCTQEINSLLDQYGCKLSCYFIMTAQRNIPKVEVISK